MNNADTIKEAIRRLEAIKPSEISAATWFQVKTWLFPRIIAYIDGFREINPPPQEKTEEELKEMADEVFGKESAG